MAQVSYGTITINDITDISDVYLEYGLAVANASVDNTYPFDRLGEISWDTTYPTWQPGYQIWIREVQEKEGVQQKEPKTPYLDTAVNQINDNYINLQSKIKKIWSNSNGSYMASGIGSNEVDENDVFTYGYNSKSTTTGISFNYNAIPLIEMGILDSTFNGIKLYSPVITNSTITGNRLDATLTSEGLKLLKGGIVAGSSTPGSNGYVYLSTEDYSGSSTITINGNSSGWRQIIGTKFGVKNDGTLYASNVNINGTITTSNITATGGKIGGWVINSGQLISDPDAYGKRTVMQAPGANAMWVFAAGGTDTSTYGAYPFRVNKDGFLYASNAEIEGKITADSGTIGGWTATSDSIYKSSDVTQGTASTQYQTLLYAPETATSSNWAIRTRYRSYDGTTYGDWTTPFYVRYDGYLGASNANITGAITATSFSAKSGNTVRATVDSNGLTVNNSSGTSIANFGNTIRLGLTSQRYLTIGNDGLSFYKNSGVIYGYIGSDQDDSRNIVLGSAVNNYRFGTIEARGGDGIIILQANYGTDSSPNTYGNLTLRKDSWFIGNFKDGTLTTALQSASNKLALYYDGRQDSNITFYVTPSSGSIHSEGGLILYGHSSVVGTVITGDPRDNLTLTSGTAKYLDHLTVPAGKWIARGRVRFPANTSGARRLNVSTTQDSDGLDIQIPAGTNYSMQLEVVAFLQPTSSTTYYLNAYQNSGTSLTASAVSFSAIRIV